jgi:hypothetical protein
MMFAISSITKNPMAAPTTTIGEIFGPPPLTSKNLMIPAEDIGPETGSDFIPFILFAFFPESLWHIIKGGNI